MNPILYSPLYGPVKYGRYNGLYNLYGQYDMGHIIWSCLAQALSSPLKNSPSKNTFSESAEVISQRARNILPEVYNVQFHFHSNPLPKLSNGKYDGRKLIDSL